MAKQQAGKKPTMADQADRHVLYQKSVQAPEAEVAFFDQVFPELRGRKALSMKEDFCGTAYLAAEWCKSDPQRTAIGVDYDEEPSNGAASTTSKPKAATWLSVLPCTSTTCATSPSRRWISSAPSISATACSKSAMN